MQYVSSAYIGNNYTPIEAGGRIYSRVFIYHPLDFPEQSVLPYFNDVIDFAAESGGIQSLLGTFDTWENGDALVCLTRNILPYSFDFFSGHTDNEGVTINREGTLIYEGIPGGWTIHTGG